MSPEWASDGQSIYYIRTGTADGSTAIVERDLTSGNEKEVIRQMGRTNPMDTELSFDGRYFAALDRDWFAGAPVLPGRDTTMERPADSCEWW